MRYQAIAIIALALLLPSQLAASANISVQVATFSKEVRALKAAKSLRTKGLSCDYVKIGDLYKVYCGKFSSKSDASMMRRLVRDEGFKDAFYILTPQAGVIESTAPVRPAPAIHAAAPEPQQQPVKAPADTVTRKAPEPVTAKQSAPIGKQPSDKVIAPAPILTPAPIPAKPLEAKAPTLEGKKIGDSKTAMQKAPAPPQEVEKKAPQQKQHDKPKHDPKEEQSIDRITADIFERNNRHFHPFLSTSVIGSSNIFYSETGEVSDTIYLSTLGIWASLPAMKSNVFEETTSNITPGGWELPMFYSPGDRLYQVYALYKAEPESYASHSELDFTGHKAQAHAEYNLRSGHSVIVDDIYTLDHDGFDVGIANSINEFKSNLARLTLIVRPSPKSSMELETRSYTLSYDEAPNTYKDRSDSALRASFDYKPLGKTAFGLEYARTNLDYDSSERSDRTDTDILGRIKWEATGKSTGLIKIGTSKRRFDSGTEEPDSRLKILAQLDYQLSPKTSFELKSWLYRNETDYSTADFADVSKHIATLKWKITGKTSLTFEDEYQTNNYIDTNPAPGASSTIRTDKFNDALLRVQSQMRRWLTVEVGVENQRRTSSIDSYSYEANFWYTSISLTF